MTFGLEISTNSGVIALSSRFQNYLFAGTRDFSGAVSIDVAGTPSPPLVFLRLPAGSSRLINMYRLHKTVANPGIGGYTVSIDSVGATGTATAYIFKRAPVTPTGHGLALYDSSGAAFFLSDSKMLKVRGVASVKLVPGAGTEIDSGIANSAVMLGGGILPGSSGIGAFRFPGVEYDFSDGNYVIVDRPVIQRIAGATDRYRSMAYYAAQCSPQPSPLPVVLINTADYL